MEKPSGFLKGVVIKSGCGFYVWSAGNPPFQNPVYGPAVPETKIFIGYKTSTLKKILLKILFTIAKPYIHNVLKLHREAQYLIQCQKQHPNEI